MLGIDRRTPGYTEELRREMIRERAGSEIRAWGFKERMEKEKGSEIGSAGRK